MSDIDTPLCIAANSHTIYLASYKTEYKNISYMPPSLFLYSSQQYPTSLSSIQWKVEAGSIINHDSMGNQNLPLDDSGYWCAVDDTGTFVIMSGAKKRDDLISLPWHPSVTIQGVLYDKLSKPKSPTVGSPTVPAYDPVALSGTYPCINSQSCKGHLYVLPATLDSPSNFGFVTYNSTSGFVFETFKQTTKKFNTQDGPSIPPVMVDGVSDWNAFGYNNNRLVAVSVSAKQARAIKLDAQGQPEATAINQFDASAASDCAQIERGYFANVNNRSYFSCSLRSKPGQYAMFSFEKASITKVAEFPIKIDGMLKGLIPAPKQGGGVPTWAFAYSDRKNGLWAVELPGESSEGGDKKQASRRAGIIGGAVGGVAAVIVVILAVFFWHHKRNQKKSSESQTQDEPQLPENNHPTSVNANGMTLPADNNEVKGDGHLPKIEEPPLPPLPQEALSQSQQHLHSQPQLQSYTLSYPHAFPQQYPQQYPQPAPHLDQMYHAYPQPQMYQNSMQQHQQPYPSTAAYTAPTTIPTLATVPASTADAPALTATPTTIPVVSNNSAPAEPLQQELQFSNHPRPNVATTVGGANPLTAANLPMTAGL